jgi:signal transduction histidine kinase
MFAAVTEEVGKLLTLDVTTMLRYEMDGTATVVAAWRQPSPHLQVGARLILDGENVAAAVLRTRRPARNRPFRHVHRSSRRLGEFTELVATAVANAESKAELTASRARIVATGDEARSHIERDLHDGVQQRLVSLSLDLRAVEELARGGDRPASAQAVPHRRRARRGAR